DAHGLVSTLVIEGTDAHGNELQWGRTFLFLSNGPQVEVYEEDGIDAALARFEELRPQARRLENAASQVTERFLAHFAAREWDAMPQILGDNFSYDDRRRVVGSGVRPGGDDHVADMRASADLWTANLTPAVMAVRGERLVLANFRFPGRDQGPDAFVTHVLGIVEINAAGRLVTFVS